MSAPAIQTKAQWEGFVDEMVESSHRLELRCQLEVALFLGRAAMKRFFDSLRPRP
jgi:hypothetical protein